jgi:hypothetical protein
LEVLTIENSDLKLRVENYETQLNQINLLHVTIKGTVANTTDWTGSHYPSIIAFKSNDGKEVKALIIGNSFEREVENYKTYEVWVGYSAWPSELWVKVKSEFVVNSATTDLRVSFP